MAFVTYGGAKNYRKWSLWSEGEFVQGYFQRLGNDVKNPDKRNYVIKITETNVTEIPIDQDFVANDTTVLNGAWNEANPAVGDLVRIDYLGKKPPKKQNGQPYHVMTVSVDRDETSQTITKDELEEYQPESLV